MSRDEILDDHIAGAAAASALPVADMGPGSWRGLAMLEDVLDSMSDGFFAYDGEWRVAYMNGAARQMLEFAGLDPDRALGQVLWDLVPGLRGTPFQQNLLRCATERITVRFESAGPKSGRWVESTAVPIAGGVAVFSHDIGGRRRSDMRQHLMVNTGALLGRPEDVESALKAVARVATQGFCDACFVTVEPPSGEEGLRLRHAAFRDDDPTADVMQTLFDRFPKGAEPTVGEDHVLRTGEPQVLGEGEIDGILAVAATSDEHLDLMRQARIGSIIIIPLVARNRAFGTLSFLRHASATPGEFDAGDVRTGEELGRRVAMAVDNARLFVAERAARARAERLQDLATALSASATFDDVAEAILTEGMALVGATGGRVVRPPEPGERMLYVVNYRGWSEGEHGPLAPIPIDAAVPTADAVSSGSIVWVREHEMPARYPDLAPIARRGGYRTWIAVPFRHGGRTIGAFGLALPDDRPESDDMLALLRTMAHQCAQAIERIRLYEAAQAARHAAETARTEAESARAEAEYARAEAEAASKAKSDFLAMMSHELRTPLNAIAGYVELLEMGIRGPITEQQRSDLARIRSAERTLLRRIDDVLTFARLDAGQVDFEAELVNVAELIEEVEPLIAPQVDAGGIEYVCEPCEADLVAIADAGKASQVLLNLVANAIKFTPVGGRVTVTATIQADHVVVSVSDTGVGIPPEKLDYIFEPFMQVDTRLTREHGGAGLGLAISRDLVRGMGGELSVASELGQGSTFHMMLPRPTAA